VTHVKQQCQWYDTIPHQNHARSNNRGRKTERMPAHHSVQCQQNHQMRQGYTNFATEQAQPLAIH